MKKLLLSGWLCFTLLSFTSAQFVGERSGYEGDYFSLEGALDLFQNSKNLKQFERKLNREDSWVNNLDLNYDGEIDYIRVEHNRQGSFHAIVLQAIISRYEIQDVAVIEIEKVSRYDAVLQIVGDADLYGEEVIVESQRNRDNYASNVSYRGYDNVYYWEPVQYIFAPRYVVYVSPYRWSYYPTWWSPWRQCAWNVYYPRVVTYHNYYHVVNVHRVVNVHNYYYPSRTYCNTVMYRANRVRKQHGHSNAYRSTHKRNNTSYAKTVGNQRATRPGKNSATSIRRPGSKGGATSTSVRRPSSQSKKPVSRGARTSTSVHKPLSQGKRPTTSKPRTGAVSKKPANRATSSSTSVRRPSSQSKKPSSQGVNKPWNRSQSGHKATNTRSTNRSSQARAQRSNSSARSTTSSSKRPAASRQPSRSSSSARSSGASRTQSAQSAPSRSRSSASTQRPSRSANSSRSSASKRSSSASSAPRKQYTAPKKSTPRASSSSRSSAAKPRAKSSSSSSRKSSAAKKSVQRSGSRG